VGRHLFAGFLGDRELYRRTEEYWNALLRPVMGEHSWRMPWLTTKFVDGADFLDGNPIFSAISRDGAKGVRITQVEPGTEAPEFAAWMHDFGDDAITRVLAIRLVLTKDTADVSRRLVRRWCSSRLTDEELAEEVRRHHRGG
jgi:hypothetical protein